MTSKAELRDTIAWQREHICSLQEDLARLRGPERESGVWVVEQTSHDTGWTWLGDVPAPMTAAALSQHSAAMVAAIENLMRDSTPTAWGIVDAIIAAVTSEREARSLLERVLIEETAE